MKPRKGPKPKPIEDRNLQIRRIRPSYSHQQKVRVLVFLFNYRVPSEIEPGEFRLPTQLEASEVFNVPQPTISYWVRNREQIEQFGAKSNVHSIRTIPSVCRWPELESRLYDLFLSRREQGQPIRRGWFRVHANQIFRELYPASSPSIFRFSNGWFQAFLGRYRVSLRCITKKAQKVPEDYRKLVINWLRFNRRNSQLPTGAYMAVVLNRAAGRFFLSNICNLDETPLPFEYLSGRTYQTIGSTTVWVRETRNGWDKRQASLVLCIFADGINRVPPMIIFRGKGKAYSKEEGDYHPGVIVEFNEEAYMNESLFIRYIEMHLIPALQGRPTLFAIDMCGSHKTPAALEVFRNNNIIPSFIPAGCTSLVQPLDVSVNKPLKDMVRDNVDQAIFDCESVEAFEKWTVKDRRTLTTWCVGDAWYQFCIEKKDLVERVFRKVGLSLNADGSEDSELDIKGFEQLEIGDWRHDLVNSSSYTDVDTQEDNNEAIEFVAHGE